MPDVRHLDFNLDKNFRVTLDKEIGGLAQDFCEAVGSNHIMQLLETSFTYHLKAYVEHTNLGMSETASSHRQEARRLIKRAKRLSRCFD